MKHNNDYNARKKKGEAAKYITRNAAIKLLQVPLKSFRRLCVLKGIFPRKPSSYRKVQEGDPTERILYLRDDIRSLLMDPAVWAIREQKQYLRKFNRLKRKSEQKKLQALRKRKPIINVDHIVLERYPTFSHALQDLDDPLCSIFFTGMLQASRIHPSAVVNKCKRLSIEFLHFVIQARALRKVFITLKGYYYRVEVQGIDITWVVPHPFPIKDDSSIDQSILQHSNEFYVRLMTFVNYKLYQSINMPYPPRIQSCMERISQLRSTPSANKAKLKKKLITVKSDMKNSILALSVPVIGKKKSKNDAEDEYDTELLEGHFGCKTNEVKEVLEKTEKQKKIFEGLKFFLNMETNRESLTFVIRSGGGEVSWAYSLGHGHRYPEEDKTITHQIVDRPNCEKKYLTRYYIQPQWVYDSFNHALLLPVQDYFVGATLPAHLSPFEETYKNYVPPELKKIQILREQGDAIDFESLNDIGNSGEKKQTEEETVQPTIIKKPKRVKRSGPLGKMAVKPGKAVVRDLQAEKRAEDQLTHKFAESMVHKRQKKLYKKIVEIEQDKQQKADTLQKARAIIDGFKEGKLDKIIRSAKHQSKADTKLSTKKKIHKSKDSQKVLLIKSKNKDQHKKFYKQKPTWNH